MQISFTLHSAHHQACLYLKLLYSSTPTSADHQSRQREVSHMTDEKGETWSPFGMSRVRSRPDSWWQTVRCPRRSHLKGAVAGRHCRSGVGLGYKHHYWSRMTTFRSFNFRSFCDFNRSCLVVFLCAPYGRHLKRGTMVNHWTTNCVVFRHD